MTIQERADNQFKSHPDLRVLFFFDPDERFRDEIDGWDHEDIHCIEAGPALFSLKYRLNHELQGERVLLYASERRPGDWSDYPLADLLAANRELRVDPVAGFMETFELGGQHRSLIQRYFNGELEHKGRRRFLGSTLSNDRLSERALKRGLAAFHLDVSFRSVPQEEQLIAGLFVQGTSAQAFDDYCATCDELALSEYLGRLLSRYFELDTLTLSREAVRTAAQRMKYNLLMRPVSEVRSDDPYRTLRIESVVTLNQLEGLANAWRAHGALERSPADVLDELAPEVDETKLLATYGPDTDFGYMTPALQRQRLEQAVSWVQDQPSRARETARDLQRSATPVNQAAQLIEEMASFYHRLKGYPTLDLGTAEKILAAYAEDLCACDGHYRRAARLFRALKQSGSGFASTVADVHERFLHDYHDAFVHPLNKAWQRELEKRAKGDSALSVDAQGAFYTRYIGSTDQKTAVIISDALRFEVAQELVGRLVQRDARKQADLSPMLAALPSVTSIGMAHLLPHDTIEINEDDITIADQRASGTSGREKILQAAQPDARAIQAQALQEMSRDEGRAFFKSRPLTYVYHNRIDAVGDDPKTEANTPEAVEEALSDLQQLIQTLNNWNVYRVVVTADHGFLYTDHDLPESMKESFPDVGGQVLRRNRCIVAREFTTPDGYRFPIEAYSDITGALTVGVPRAVNRYRLRGAGERYAHGGASLQELVVPVIEVRKTREDVAEEVGVRLLSQDRVIRSGALSVQFLQTEAVSSSRQARTVVAGLYDDQGTPVAEEKELVLNSEAAGAKERTQKFVFTLGPKANRLNFCRLKVFGEEDHNRLDPLIDQRYSIQRLIEQDDF